jgi:hypothetical protein
LIYLAVNISANKASNVSVIDECTVGEAVVGRRAADYGYTEIRNEHLRNTNLKRDCYNSLLGDTPVLSSYLFIYLFIYVLFLNKAVTGSDYTA